jgi:hypothetical protein
MAALIPTASATGSGTMTLAGPSTNSNQTVTIPDATGTMMVSGNMPAFSAYQSSATSVSNATGTKILFGNETFDTNNNFDSTTNYRFTPTVSGYYQINGGTLLGFSGSNGFLAFCSIYKNGAEYLRGSMYYVNSGTAINQGSAVSGVIYFNGSTDYVELYVRGDASSGTITTATSSVPFNYFSGSLIRGA